MASETTTLAREVVATEVPSGRPLPLAAGARVLITQALGGSVTVLTEGGHLARIGEADADALGRAAPAAREPAPAEAPASLEEQVWSALRTVYDPEIPVNVVELGLIYGCEVVPDAGGSRVSIRMTLTAPGCAMGEVIASEIERKVRALAGVAQAEVEIVFDPPWDPSRMSEAARLELGFL